MAPSHVRVVERLHVKQLTGESVGQPLSSEITHPGCRPCVKNAGVTPPLCRSLRLGGYPIGSGGIESANKFICHTRIA